MNLPPHIEAKIVRVPFCGCWIWTGSGDRYGVAWYEGRRIRAHHLLFRLAGNTIPAGMEVMHACDIGLCVNPAHLSVGTHADNMADMVRKGRSRAPSGERHWSRSDPERARLVARTNIKRSHYSGERNSNAKVTAEVSARIRAAYAANPSASMTQLGRSFGLGREQTRKIVKGIAWKS